MLLLWFCVSIYEFIRCKIWLFEKSTIWCWVYAKVQKFFLEVNASKEGVVNVITSSAINDGLFNFCLDIQHIVNDLPEFISGQVEENVEKGILSNSS